jgi:hypothetical protein
VMNSRRVKGIGVSSSSRCIVPFGNGRSKGHFR